MHRRKTLNLGTFICLAATFYLLYYLLLGNEHGLPFSIHCVAKTIDDWARGWHFLVIGLLPIYIAFMILAASFVGIYLGLGLQRLIRSLPCFRR